ncbi:MAG: multiheme c-type cytochrome, partial [Nitrospinota bacterium]
LADSEDGCIRCHYNKEKFEKLVLEWNESKHSKKKVTCIKCHGGNSKAKDIGKAKAKETTDFRHVKESITTKQGEELMSLAFDYCGQCHGHIYKDWVAGIHGKRTGSWNGEKEYWVCTKCHPPHNPKFQKIVPKAPPHGPLEIQFKGPQ